MFESLIAFIQEQYRSNGFIPLHAPTFGKLEREYVDETLCSTLVSSVGPRVYQFEKDVMAYTGCERAVAMVNGTAALHLALLLSGVRRGDLVVTQPLTFVATCNAIRYCGAEPLFIDVERRTLGLSPAALSEWLDDNAYLDRAGECRMKSGERVVRTCVPMHTFGHPVDLDELVKVCEKWNIAVVEDAAEALGSFYKGRHAGTIGRLGILSFNGNKIVTTGGGGMILTNEILGSRAKHLSTTAKKPHAYLFDHDELGFNYRLPNLNAALGCAQLQSLEEFVANKRRLAERYQEFFLRSDLEFIEEPGECRSNYWLNAVICESEAQRDALLRETNEKNVMTRPIWTLMTRLPMYAGCPSGSLRTAEWLAARVVNLPSSVTLDRDPH